MENLVNKTINLELVSLNGNTLALLGAFIHQAKREGWSDAEIKTVTTQAERGDYIYLLSVLETHCSPKDGE